MKPPATTWKSVVLTLVVAVVFYFFVAWPLMSRWQSGKGPWQVDFTTNPAGVPQLVIAQPSLGFSNITVRFDGEQLAATNQTGVVAFSRPRTPTPFGRVVYDDLMIQPGSVAVDCFGHVVEMIPRKLILNGTSNAWQNGAVYAVSPTNKLPPEVRQKWKGGYRQ